VYFSYGTTATPPGTAHFTLSAQVNNQNNPNVKPQTSRNYEVGSKWDFFDRRLSVNSALFRTENKNVIFTVDATAIPPVYNQDDAQRVDGLSVGAIGQITYELPFGLTLGAGLRHTDAVWINTANTIQAPGYRTVDATAQYRVNEHLSLRVNVYNLTNETYIRNVNNNGGRSNPGNPRSMAVTPTITF
jgi:catecholate siderophore receptor